LNGLSLTHILACPIRMDDRPDMPPGWQPEPPGARPSTEPEPQPPAPPPVRLRDGLVVLAVLFGAQLAGGLAVGLYLGVRFAAAGGDISDPQSLRELQARVMAPGIVGGVVASTLAVLIYAVRSLRGPARAARRRALGVVRSRAPALALAFATGVAIAVGYMLFAQFVARPTEPITRPGPLTQMGTSPGWPQWSWALIGLCSSPWIEEFVFRGQLLAALESAWGRRAAAVITTVLFLALHFQELIGYPPGAFGITALAVAALAARLWTGSVAAAMGVHFGYNAMIAGVVLAVTAAR